MSDEQAKTKAKTKYNIETKKMRRTEYHHAPKKIRFDSIQFHYLVFFYSKSKSKDKCRSSENSVTFPFIELTSRRMQHNVNMVRVYLTSLAYQNFCFLFSHSLLHFSFCFRFCSFLTSYIAASYEMPFAICHSLYHIHVIQFHLL